MGHQWMQLALAGMAKHLLRKSRPWRAVSGPFGALLLTLRRLGWQINCDGTCSISIGTVPNSWE
eukprot:1207904-Amphidinium_carterae.1